MKKLLLSIITFSVLGAGSAFAQCTPDLTNEDIISFPDGATMSNDTVFLPELVNYTYSETVQFYAPDTLIISNLTATVNWLKVDNITGLPAGLSYECDNADCTWTGGTNGCLTISGTADSPITPGTQFELDITLSGEAVVPGLGTVPVNNATIEAAAGETTVILAAAANLTIEEEAFNTVALYPNPSSTVSTMNFTAQQAGTVLLSVTDMSGRTLYSVSVENNAGVNSIELPVASFKAGMYQVTLSNGNFAVQSQLAVRK